MPKNDPPSHRLTTLLPAALLALIGLVLLAAAFLPFATLKSMADGLMPDGEFESLNAGNAVVFKAVFFAGALAFVAQAGLSFFYGWNSIWKFLKQLWVDVCLSFRSLRPARQEWLSLLVLAAVMGTAVVFRLEYIFSSLHHDEAYTYMVFSHSLRAAVTDYHLPNNHVFHSILVFFSTQLFGNEPWSVRLPALVAGVLLVPSVYALGKRHYDRWVGFGAALLVAISPDLISYSDNARGYTLVALFGLLLLLLGHTVRAAKNRFAWVLIGLVSALGVYTNPAFLFPFGILYVWLLLENRMGLFPGYTSHGDFLKYWSASGLAAAALTLVLYLPILVYSGPEKLFANDFVSPVPWSDLIETLSQRLVDTWVEWTFRVPLAVFYLVVVGWTLSLLFHRRISSTRVPLQLAAGLWILILLLLQRPNAWSKVWVFLIPLALLWATAGIIGLLGQVKVRSVALSALAVGLLFIACLGRAAWLLPQLPELWAVLGDEEKAVLFVESQLLEDDKLVVAPPDDASVWYYAELHGLYSAVYQPESGYDRLFVFVNPDEGQTPASVLSKRGPGQEAAPSCHLLQTFGKIQVYECQESP